MPRPLPKLEEDTNEHFRKQDEEMMTPDDQLEEYTKLYDRMILRDGNGDAKFLSLIRVEDRMIKIDLYPLGEPTTYNPLHFTSIYGKGDYHFD